MNRFTPVGRIPLSGFASDEDSVADDVLATCDLHETCVAMHDTGVHILYVCGTDEIQMEILAKRMRL